MSTLSDQPKSYNASRRSHIWARMMPHIDGFATNKDTFQRAEKRLKDFAAGGLMLYWRRQGIYLGAGLLCGIYYSILIAAMCYALCQVAELADTLASRKVLAWANGTVQQCKKYYRLLLLTSTLSSVAVAIFVFFVAYLEGTSSHFTPLFFLFAAGLFAAVNNHQIPQILTVRLVIYGALFLFIPLHDIFILSAPLNSPHWLQFMTSVFVLYFVLDCSFIFLKMYRNGLDQLDELRVQRDAAQRAYKVKSEFVSVVSHELRTPLTSINGALSLMRSGALKANPERYAEVMEIAYKNSLRLAALINDLLDIQRLEHGALIYNFENTDIVDLVQDSVDSISTYATPKQINVNFVHPDTGVIAYVDRARMHQVFDNLLSNAIKFSDVGGDIEISLTKIAGHASISVKDHGIGIPENAREQVFGRFSQVDSSDRRSFGGSGLGLSIAQEIVKSHGGTIDYVSELEVGSTFTVELPLVG